MSFSRLLLVASNSKKYITGEGRNDKVVISPRKNSVSDDPYTGEVILCFQLDDTKDKEKQKRIARSLSIPEEEARCDGLIFYAKDGLEEKVICLVEMKSDNISKAAEQLKSTKDHIKNLLHAECSTNCNKELQKIKWKACLYHHGASLDNIREFLRQLKSDGVIDVATFTAADNNVGPFLRDEVNAKSMASKYKGPKKK